MAIAPRRLLDSPERIARLSDRLILISMLIPAPLMLMLSLTRKFNHDEFEAIKSAWKIYAGEHIYVDFFQHHHPLLYYLLAPLFTLFGESIAVVLASRLIILLFASGIFLTTYRIARLLFDKQVASVSVLFLFAATMFVDKTIEVRPDVPQTFFALLSVYLIYSYFASQRLRHLLASSLSLGIAFLFLQKILFLAILLHVLLAWRCLKRQLKFQALLVFSSVFLGTWSVYGLYLLLTDQFTQYFFFNFEFNLAKLERHRHQTEILIQHLASAYNGIVLFHVIFFPWTNKNQAHRELALLTGALLTFTVLYRTQHAQYYLTVIPLLAIVAARGWAFLASRQPAIAALGLAMCVIGAAAIDINDLLKRQNGWQLDKIAYVYERTSKTDHVYDGDNKFNLFRKDLDFFWYSVGPGDSLAKYKRLKGYDYDVYALIDKLKPKVISDYAITNLQNPVIRDHYIQSDRFKNLYLRLDAAVHEASGSSSKH